MSRIPLPRAPGRPRSSASTVTPISHAKTAPAEDDDVTTSGDDTPAGPAPVDSLSEMMAGLRGADNSRVVIYRIVKNQPPSYVSECDPASFSMDDLRDKYRGGAFRLYIMKDGKLWKNMPVYVEPPPHDASAQASTMSSGMGDVLAVMRDGFAAQAAAMRELAATPRAASPLANMDIPSVITAIAAAITALRPPPAPPAPPPPPDRSVDMLIQGIQLASELREGASPPDNSIGGMLRTVLQSPLMAQAVQAATAPPPPQPRPAPPVAPALPQPAKPAEAPKTQEPAPVNAVLHHYYGMLCQKAATGADPTLYAEVILDNVDDDTLNALLSRQPTPLDALIAEYPPAAAHRDWFATLVDTLMQAMSEEEAPDAPEANPVVAGLNGANADAAHAPTPIVPGQPS